MATRYEIRKGVNEIKKKAEKMQRYKVVSKDDMLIWSIWGIGVREPTNIKEQNTQGYVV